MTFLNPLLATLGLAAIAIPIIIHFFMRRRRKPVMWGAMRFLIEAYKRQRRRLMFEQWLLLLVRCALIALLALAIGRMFLGGGESEIGARTLYIAIDSGLTASAADDNGRTALDRHKERAGELLDELSGLRGDRAGLVLLGAPAEAMIVPATSDLSRVRSALAAIEASDAGGDMAGAVRAIDEALLAEEDSAATVALLSDWREGSLRQEPGSSAPTTIAPADSRVTVASTPASEPLENFTIREVRPRRSVLIAGGAGDAGLAGSGQVAVALRRTGSIALARRAVDVAISLERNGGRVSLGSGIAVFEAGQSETSVVIPFTLNDATPGHAALVTHIRERDAIAGDNVRRRGLEVRRELRVGVVSDRSLASVSLRRFEAPDWVGVALEPSGSNRAGRQIDAEALLPGSIDAARLSRYDAVMVTIPDRLSESAWRQLRGFVEQGGLLFVAPDANSEAQNGLASMVETLDLPWALDLEAREFESPVTLANPDPEALSSNLIGVLLGEFESLARPVGVQRLLNIRDIDDGEIVVRTEAGDPFLVGGRGAGEGRRAGGLVVLLLSAIDPAWTTLPTKPLMVPLMQEIVRQGVGEASMVATTVAGRPMSLDARAVALEPLTPDAPPIAIAGEREVTTGRAGVWRVREAQGAAERLAIVNPDADAGDTTVVSPDRARDWLARRASEVTWLDDGIAMHAGSELASDAGSNLSLGLFLAALILGVVETMMARFTSHADAGGSP